ncbi:uncharacterized protein PgNI_06841 [Pyricularia grisea]|uniref:Uncharacterized protein n=1 Tax=Pyricularia grisea TaxID=148305 RepID=A0A6P8B100_PYRGI|nr:uncharacterized protein PgNI_06841 [Pyricularia grisea]TLD08514.1 hypothetical protein PgNI_06841 [Pyricularia grisea]
MSLPPVRPPLRCLPSLSCPAESCPALFGLTFCAVIRQTQTGGSRKIFDPLAQEIPPRRKYCSCSSCSPTTRFSKQGNFARIQDSLTLLLHAREIFNTLLLISFFVSQALYCHTHLAT